LEPVLSTFSPLLLPV
jgi:hypothetical protein